MSEKGGGCLKWLLIGLAVVVLVLFLLYYVIFHTAWPIRKIVDAMIEGTDITVEGIEGSISSGVSIEKIRIPEEDGKKVTEIDNIAFRYKFGGDTFTVNDISVGRAHIFVNNLLKEDPEKDAKGNKIAKKDPPPPAEGQQKNVIVKKIDIANVTLEDIKTGAQVKIDKIYLDGFEVIDNKVKLGTLTVKSDYCNIEIKPVDSSLKLAAEHVIKGLINKEIHDAVIKDITINGNFMTKDKDTFKINLELFDGKIKIRSENPNDIRDFQINSFSPNEYISSVFCIRHINVKYNGSDKKYKTDVANYKIGNKLFEMERRIFTDGKENKDLKAVYKDSNAEYTCLMTEKKNGLPKIELSSIPAMEQNDILGMLLFDSKYDKLSDDQKEQIDAELKKAE